MGASDNKDQDGKPLEIVETDVLGLEKNKSTSSGKGKPNRIFIVFGILLVLAMIYWWYTR